MATAFEAFAAERFDALMRLARLLTGNSSDAEDLVQDALLHAHGQWDKVVAADNPHAYTRRLLTNLYTSQQRRRRPRTVPLDTVDGDRLEAPTGSDLGEREAMRQAIASLPVRQRTALVLRYYEDLDTGEIAVAMGLNESSVRSALSRALDNIRAHDLDLPKGEDPCTTSSKR